MRSAPYGSTPFNPYAAFQRQMTAPAMHPAATHAAMAASTYSGMHPAQAQALALQGGARNTPIASGDLYGARSNGGGEQAGPLQSTAERYARQFEQIFGIANARVRVQPQTSWGTQSIAELVDESGPIESLIIDDDLPLWRVPSVIGHEYGHALQIAAGRGNLPDVQRELEATRINGRFLRLSGSSLEAALADLMTFEGSAIHGTREQQIAALTEGFNDPDGAWFEPLRAATGPVTFQQAAAPATPAVSRAQLESLSWSLGLQTWDTLLQLEIDFSDAIQTGNLTSPETRQRLQNGLERAKSNLAALEQPFADGDVLFQLRRGGAPESFGHLPRRKDVTLGDLKAELAALERMIGGEALPLDAEGFRFVGREEVPYGEGSLVHWNVTYRFERPGANDIERLDVTTRIVRSTKDAAVDRKSSSPVVSVATDASGSSLGDRYALSASLAEQLFGAPNRDLFEGKKEGRQAAQILELYGA